MRVRKAAYAMSARFRFERTGKVAREPRNLDDVFVNDAIK